MMGTRTGASYAPESNLFYWIDVVSDVFPTCLPKYECYLCFAINLHLEMHVALQLRQVDVAVNASAVCNCM